MTNWLAAAGVPDRSMATKMRTEVGKGDQRVAYLGRNDQDSLLLDLGYRSVVLLRLFVNKTPMIGSTTILAIVTAYDHHHDIISEARSTPRQSHHTHDNRPNRQLGERSRYCQPRETRSHKNQPGRNTNRTDKRRRLSTELTHHQLS